jgi:hypothetical protein
VQKLHSLIACRNIVKDKFAGCSRSSPKLAAARRKAKQAVTSIRYAPSRPEGWHGSENVDLALHRRPSGCHLSQRGSDHLSPTSQDGLSDRVANCCNSTDGAHNLRQTGYFDLQHSIAIFAFFFRYFSSTRPNEFFQIQAYLIHWFRLFGFAIFAINRWTQIPPSPSLRRTTLASVSWQTSSAQSQGVRSRVSSH